MIEQIRFTGPMQEGDLFTIQLDRPTAVFFNNINVGWVRYWDDDELVMSLNKLPKRITQDSDDDIWVWGYGSNPDAGHKIIWRQDVGTMTAETKGEKQ